MPVSPEDAVNAYVNEPMVMVVIDLTLFSSVKPSEPSVIDDAGVGLYGFVMFMI